MSFKSNLNSESVKSAWPVEPEFVLPTATIREVFEVLRDHRDGSVLVTKNDALIGIFTERDALRLMAEGGDLDTPIEKVMTTDPVTISADASVGDAIAKMSAGGYRRLPIVDSGGRVEGVVKVSGIVHFLVEHVSSTVYNLPPQPKSITQEREGA